MVYNASFFPARRTTDSRLCASTNRQTGDVADTNGNLGSGSNYDVANRLIQAAGTTMTYAYAADNKRVWRGDGVSVDEIAYWSPGGQKLATYQVQVNNQTHAVSFSLSTTDVYFGARLIAKGTYTSSCPHADCVTLASVATDRLGSIREVLSLWAGAALGDAERYREIHGLLPRRRHGARLRRSAVSSAGSGKVHDRGPGRQQRESEQSGELEPIRVCWRRPGEWH
ncbi:MAG TPA: hypothetical protein VGR73_04375 [Bryobacteraceae bacterium]|nr:hypothetical protein [Bryobacteraceae bacterium]